MFVIKAKFFLCDMAEMGVIVSPILALFKRSSKIDYHLLNCYGKTDIDYFGLNNNFELINYYGNLLR